MTRTHRVSADHPCFDGHFPGHPIVPGVMLLAIVEAQARAFLGASWRISGVPVAKFLTPIGPDMAFQIRLNQAAAGVVEFTIETAEPTTKIGTGSLRFEPATS
jgi:3-hydroxyacyl-[acyl-carrier-protein] dehydratase